MPGNVEIKAYVHLFDELKTKARDLSGAEPVILKQEDTFYIVPNGRLKMRIFQDSPPELIAYSRPDQAGPKLSDFSKIQIINPEGLKEVLTRSLGVLGCVKKIRLLYMVGQTRVHVDQVDGLGEFMELEVQLSEEQTTEDGEKIADNLMLKLGINKADLIDCAYIDMLLANKNKS